MCVWNECMGSGKVEDGFNVILKVWRQWLNSCGAGCFLKLEWWVRERCWLGRYKCGCGDRYWGDHFWQMRGSSGIRTASYRHFRRAWYGRGGGFSSVMPHVLFVVVIMSWASRQAWTRGGQECVRQLFGPMALFVRIEWLPIRTRSCV